LSRSIGARRAKAAAASENNGSYRERHRAIIAAAAGTFRQRGYHGTTLADVATAAGMDRASIYYYFSSKEDLFRKVVSDAVIENIAHAEAIAKRTAPPAQKLTDIIVDLMKSFERHYPYLYVFVQEDLGTAEIGPDTTDWRATIRDWGQRYMGAVRGIIQEGIDAGTFDVGLPPTVLAQSIVGMVNGSHRWFRPQGVVSAAEIGSGMARMVLRGMCTDQRVG
jgi:AcrR family transcriptional regulator